MGRTFLPLIGLAWAAVAHVRNERERLRQEKYEKFMELIGRYNNAAGGEPLFTQLASAFELRNYPRYKDIILAIQKYQNETVAGLEDVSGDPIRSAKRTLVQDELKRTVEFLRKKK